jgi:succinyl-CoA synthetase beta subunit
MRCDVIAAGILSAAKQIGMKKPIVIRLQGTNVNEAQKLIQASGFRMIVVDELEEAATKAVAIANIVKQAGKSLPPSLPPSRPLQRTSRLM